MKTMSKFWPISFTNDEPSSSSSAQNNKIIEVTKKSLI